MTADQVLDWVTARFMQISTEDILEYPEPVLLLVWSRSMAESVAPNSLQDLASLIPGGPGGEKLCVPNVQRLAKRELGFPHGWVLEHSLVMIEPFRQGATRVFEKATPKDDSMPRVYSLQDAIAPYMGRSGLSLTLHLKLEVDDLA
jgi:hypothetical protein